MSEPGPSQPLRPGESLARAAAPARDAAEPAASQTLPADCSRPHKIPRSVLVVIHTPALEVLLIERADQPGCWQSVTGSLDHPDEPLELTARREVLEETGIASGTLRDWARSNVYEIYPVWRHRYALGVSHNTEHVFGLTVPAGTPVVLSPREHLAYQWLPWREAAGRCFSPSNAEAILQLPQFTP